MSWLVQMNVQMPFLFAPQASPFHTVVQCSSQSTDALRNAANLFAVATGVGREVQCELGYACGALNVLSLRQNKVHPIQWGSLLPGGPIHCGTPNLFALVAGGWGE